MIQKSKKKDKNLTQAELMKLLIFLRFCGYNKNDQLWLNLTSPQTYPGVWNFDWSEFLKIKKFEWVWMVWTVVCLCFGLACGFAFLYVVCLRHLQMQYDRRTIAIIFLITHFFACVLTGFFVITVVFFVDRGSLVV